MLSFFNAGINEHIFYLCIFTRAREKALQGGVDISIKRHTLNKFSAFANTVRAMHFTRCGRYERVDFINFFNQIHLNLCKLFKTLLINMKTFFESDWLRTIQF